MKMFRKTEDGAIENLLRAHAARAGNPPAPCREFDPDLANAFVEHGLTASERGRYEQHLSLCPSCRKSVVALARMAASDTAFSGEPKPRRVIREAEPRWKALLGAMSRPQWAMAAAAIVILVISVPLFLSRQGGRASLQATESQMAQTPSAGDAQAGTKAGQQTPATEMAEGSRVQETSSQLISKNQQDKPATKLARAAEASEDATEQPSAEKAAGEPSGALARLEPPRVQPIESKAADQTADQNASKEMSQSSAAAGVPVPQRTAETELAKIDAAKAKSVPEQSKDTEVSVLQPGRPDGGERRAPRDGGVVRSDDIAPPPAPSTRSRERNAITGATGGLNSRLTDPARHRGGAGERKIGSKKFWLKDDTWVDKDYSPDKEMPVITIIRDSDVYKDLLSKRQGMKSFLTGFAENDRVIFIYKGTVYKLIPQEGNK